MDRTEKLSYLESESLPLPDTFKALKSVSVVANNALRFEYSDGSASIINRSDVSFIGRSIESVTYNTFSIVFLLSNGSLITIDTPQPPLDVETLPAYLGFDGFRSVIPAGGLELIAGTFSYSAKKLNADKYVITLTSGFNQNLIVQANTWTRSLITSFLLNVEDSGVDNNAIILPAGIWKVFGSVMMSTQSNAVCQGVCRLIDVDTEEVLGYSTVFDKSATGVGTGGPVSFDCYIYLSKPTTMAVERFCTATTNVYFTNDGNNGHRFMYMTFIANE